MIIGISSDAFVVVVECLIVISHLIIGDSSGIMKFMNFFGKLLGMLIGFHVILDRNFIFLFVIIGKSHVIIEIIVTNVVLTHLSFNLLVRIVQLIKNIARIFMRSFVFFILFNSLEIPLNSHWVFFLELIVDSNVVIARSILRSHFSAFFVPINS